MVSAKVVLNLRKIFLKNKNKLAPRRGTTFCAKCHQRFCWCQVSHTCGFWSCPTPTKNPRGAPSFFVFGRCRYRFFHSEHRLRGPGAAPLAAEPQPLPDRGLDDLFFILT